MTRACLAGQYPRQGLLSRYLCLQGFSLSSSWAYFREYETLKEKEKLQPTSLTVVPGKACQAITRVIIDAVYTRSTINAGVISTVVDVC